jgi:hypothetical protein
VDGAVDCLESGLDSRNIRILASLGTPFYSSEVEKYFDRSLQDLGWNQPGRFECLIEYARSLTDQIVNGTVTPVLGCDRIYRVCVALNYSSALMTWVYLHGGLDPQNYDVLSEASLDSAIMQEARRFLNEGRSLDVLLNGPRI